MSFGLLARCDVSGGLGVMTQEVFRHLAPARTLLLDLGERGRGECDESAYTNFIGPGMEMYRASWSGALPSRAVEWITAPGIRTLYSAEVLYDERLISAARANGIRVVVHAMPELAPWATTALERLSPSAPRPELLIPTEWRAETLPGATLLPVPVARDRLPFRKRTHVEHLFHMTGAAMLDRNGTALLLAALPHVASECRLTIRSEREIHVPPCNVEVDVIEKRADNYWEAYPDDADLLILPRRYGGLSLPMQECASLGIPTLALDADPYFVETALCGTHFVQGVPTTRSRDARMKGGMVPVYDANPVALAYAIDEAIRDAERHERQSLAADRWAERHAWSGPLGAAWCEMLQADCSERIAA